MAEATRLLVVEWTGPSTAQVRLGVRDQSLSRALLVLVDVDLSTATLGTPAIWRCAVDPAGERCRMLGVNATHETHPEMIAPALDAFGEAKDQEALFAYLQSEL